MTICEREAPEDGREAEWKRHQELAGCRRYQGLVGEEVGVG
jgi:hypothetical protein